ncbi:RNA polymerase sigma factor [Arenibacter sp. ARW7G5Y1]|uniref:RNA polymerase sigma factor n=1 Tax=Arenibacter sp. ARW7G5Y1 TaxID=2135619 RepID=UPI000D76E5DD|nr:RNA polymerase sigma-70 factor [Arenibacter sp. ARW7G5Y1]PXX21717.1 RNA polymerase sigma-70 factor (ECF subfamily) [Arenibacter sp. ARW7G5Y1]
MLKKYDDLKLIDLLAKDNVSAFEEIYNRYSSQMYLYAMKILKNSETCEDIIQNIFIDFWSKRKKIEVTNVKSYLFKAVKFQIFNYLRNNKLTTEDLTRLNIIDVSMNITKQLEYDELEKKINMCVKKLPKRCQQIFVLSRFEHKSNKEIASELGISIQAVKNQISKALTAIRKNLQEDELIYFNFIYCH